MNINFPKQAFRPHEYMIMDKTGCVSLKKDTDSSGWLLEVSLNTENGKEFYRYGVSKSGTLFLSPTKTNVVYNAKSHFEFFSAPIMRFSDIVKISFYADGLWFNIPLKSMRDMCYMSSTIDSLGKKTYIPRVSAMKYSSKKFISV